jgi:hypothetical protein
MSKGLLSDRELNQYRDLIAPATTFDEGFNWRTALGTIFVAVIMLPAAMYMHLMIGEVSLGPAAQWVTVILFLEMAKRARTFLKPAEILILQLMIGLFVGHTPVEGFFWRQYEVQSDAARSFGLAGSFPDWYAPSDQAVLDSRSFFHPAWFVPLALMFVTQVVGRLDSLLLGYGLFRVASDIERLPFPMAPIQASGVLAITDNAAGNDGWRWRCFSIAAVIGMAFGAIYIAVPTISGPILGEPFRILPIPWLETSTDTEQLLPATATGLSMDLGNFFAGMAFPFFAVLGSFIGLLITFVLNPILYDAGILHTWVPGQKTVEILFSNNIDFYLSFGIGISIAVAVIGIWQTVASYREKSAGLNLDQAVAAKPAGGYGSGRGDIGLGIIFFVYVASSAFYIFLCGWLLDWDFQGSHLLWVLIFFALIYVPLISYVTARLEGLAGQALSLPMVKEAAFILSGYKGIEIWLLPIPLTHNYGVDTVGYRVAELVGCSFRSIWRMNLVALPVMFGCSLIYGQFIWGLGSIPSSAYPYAQEMWDLHARNRMLIYSSTASGYSPFMDALHWEYIATGAGLGVLTYACMAGFGLPILLMYGTVKGLGQSIPQTVVTQFAGALIGRYLLARRFGDQQWRQYALVLFTGYNCGAGLVMMAATGIRFLASAVYKLPY